MVAELCAGAIAGEDEIGFEAIKEVAPSGHFFATTQTMARYNTEFYEPIVHDYANFGTWTELGEIDANVRATSVWKKILEANNRPDLDIERINALHAYIKKRTDAGGALPVS